MSIDSTHSLHTAQNTDNNQVYNTTSCLEKPYRCPHPKIRFFLYTRYTQEHGEEIDVLNPESLWNSHWNPQHPVKVIIHGEFG
jgi:pancreatic lipase-related protein 1